MGKRKIAVMIGSDSDLSQCVSGLLVLRQHEASGYISVLSVITNSIHRNTEESLENVRELVKKGVDFLIVGAGCANHLTGTVDAFLRNTLRDYHVVVVGVAFDNLKNKKHTDAAILSITEVPGTQVVFNEPHGFVGRIGFLDACQHATFADHPTIRLQGVKPVVERTLVEAIEEARRRSK